MKIETRLLEIAQRFEIELSEIKYAKEVKSQINYWDKDIAIYLKNGNKIFMYNSNAKEFKEKTNGLIEIKGEK